MGTMQRQEDKLLLRFTLLSMPNATQSISLNAVAIDPDTARTALASGVNYHYWMRYGTLFASTFMQGFGQAVQQSGQSSSSTVTGTTTANPILSTKKEVLVGLGTVGSKLSSQLAPVFQTPPTVVLNSGTGMAILLLSDLTVPNTALTQPNAGIDLLNGNQ